jgi:hypothetical protein
MSTVTPLPPPTVDPLPKTLEEFALACQFDPLQYVCCAYPWGTGALEDAAGPDTWQVDVLEYIAQLLRDPTHVGALRIAVASGHGIGKGALAAWLISWYMSCRPRPQIVVTANTESQLLTKTWRELAKWHNLSIFKDWFLWTKTGYFKRGAEDSWFAAALAWSERKPEAFQGTHDRYVLILEDESSAIPDVIHDTIEGSMTSPQALWVKLGNPTRTTGRFREIFPGGRLAHRWYTRQIDSRTCRMPDQAQLAQWIDDYGLDSDFVKVRVLGQFPAQAVGQFISEDTIHGAYGRTLTPDPLAPLVIGVDVARYGDDRSVILVRRGAQIVDIQVYREIDTVRLTGYVCETVARYRDERPLCCIDAVGLGAGVVDQCRARGYMVQEVLGNQTPQDPQRYANKVAEMWDGMRVWLETRACLDRQAVHIRDLCAELTAREYDYDMQGRLRMERKQDLKGRGLASPDCFIAGTLVRTPAGAVCIEALRPGDEVSTPMGPRRILRLWQTDTSQVTTVRFSHGHVLSGKGKHQVFTWDSGFVRLDALSLSNAIETDSPWRRMLWQFHAQWFTPVKPFGFKALVDTISHTGEMQRSDFFIGASTGTRMGRFLLAMRSTIGMAIGRTIAWRIWSLLPSVRMRGTTWLSGWRTLKSVPEHWVGWRRERSGPESGMPRRRDVSGIARTAKRRGWGDSRPWLRVRCVEGRLRRIFQPARGFVPVPVISVRVISGIKRRLARVWSVVPRLSITSIAARRVVPVSVQTVVAPRPVAVYNLTLDGDNVYYANGILVSNCADALAMTFAYGAAPRRVEDAPAVERELVPGMGYTGLSWMAG